MEADIQEAAVGVPNAEEAYSQTGQESPITDEKIIEEAIAYCALIESEGADTSEVYQGPCCNPFHLDLYLYVAYKYKLIPKRDYKRMRSREYSSKFDKNLGKSVILLSYAYRDTFKQNWNKVFSYIRLNLTRHNALFYCNLFVDYSLHNERTPFRFLVLLSFIWELAVSICYDPNVSVPYESYLDIACAFYSVSKMGEMRQKLKEADQYSGLNKWTGILIQAWEDMSPVILSEPQNVPEEDEEFENLGQFNVANNTPESTEYYPNAEGEMDDDPHTLDELTMDDDFKVEDKHPLGGSNQRPLDLTNARAANSTGSSLPTESSFPYPMNQFPYSPSSSSGPADGHIPVQFTGNASPSHQAMKDQSSPRPSVIVHTSQHLATKSALFHSEQVPADSSIQDSAELPTVPFSMDTADLPAQDSTEQLPFDVPAQKDQRAAYPYASSMKDQLQADPSAPEPTDQLPSDLSVQNSTDKLPADMPDSTSKDQVPSDLSAQDSTEQISSGLSVLVLKDQLQTNPSIQPLTEQLPEDICVPGSKDRLSEVSSSQVPTGESRETGSSPIGEAEGDEAEADTNKEAPEEAEGGAAGGERPDPEGEDGGSPTKRIWRPRPKKSKKKKSRNKW